MISGKKWAAKGNVSWHSGGWRLLVVEMSIVLTCSVDILNWRGKRRYGVGMHIEEPVIDDFLGLATDSSYVVECICSYLQ